MIAQIAYIGKEMVNAVLVEPSNADSSSSSSSSSNGYVTGDVNSPFTQQQHYVDCVTVSSSGSAIFLYVDAMTFTGCLKQTETLFLGISNVEVPDMPVPTRAQFLGAGCEVTELLAATAAAAAASAAAAAAAAAAAIGSGIGSGNNPNLFHNNLSTATSTTITPVPIESTSSAEPWFDIISSSPDGSTDPKNDSESFVVDSGSIPSFADAVQADQNLKGASITLPIMGGLLFVFGVALTLIELKRRRLVAQHKDILDRPGRRVGGLDNVARPHKKATQRNLFQTTISAPQPSSADELRDATTEAEAQLERARSTATNALDSYLMRVDDSLVQDTAFSTSSARSRVNSPIWLPPVQAFSSPGIGGQESKKLPLQPVEYKSSSSVGDDDEDNNSVYQIASNRHVPGKANNGAAALAEAATAAEANGANYPSTDELYSIASHNLSPPASPLIGTRRIGNPDDLNHVASSSPPVNIGRKNVPVDPPDYQSTEEIYSQLAGLPFLNSGSLSDSSSGSGGTNNRAEGEIYQVASPSMQVPFGADRGHGNGERSAGSEVYEVASPSVHTLPTRGYHGGDIYAADPTASSLQLPSDFQVFVAPPRNRFGVVHGGGATGYQESDIDAESSVYDNIDNVAADNPNNAAKTLFQRHFSTGTTLTETDCDGDSVVDVDDESIYDQNPSLHAGSVSGWERQLSSETDYALIGEGDHGGDVDVDADADMDADAESDYELSVEYAHGAAPLATGPQGRTAGGGRRMPSSGLARMQSDAGTVLRDSDEENYTMLGDVGEC